LFPVCPLFAASVTRMTSRVFLHQHHSRMFYFSNKVLTTPPHLQ
jgi:hypothetical protein